MLTPAEIEAAKNGLCEANAWGKADENGAIHLCPVGQVAVLRGAAFADVKGWVLPITTEGLNEALKDVIDWLGFTDYNEYLRTLEHEGEAILKRARY